MNKIAVLVVGSGGYGGVVLKEILKDSPSDMEIVAIVDPYAEKSPLFTTITEMNIPIFEDMEGAFSTLRAQGIQVQFTYIATPIQFHVQQIFCAVKNGSNVLCEKPMTGDLKDVAALENLVRESDKFVAIGYQWSFSRAIQALKSDVQAGVFGKPLLFKTLVFWPRNESYFTRSTGWAGKIYAANGEKILDSIVNNAAAHFLHNILYVLGKERDGAVSVTDLRATLLCVNDIQTFDTANVHFTMDNGAKGILVFSHSTKEEIEPMFTYYFEEATVAYSAETGKVIAHFNDGRVKEYGDPFTDGAANKFRLCIQAVKQGEREILCGVNAAKEQVKCVALLHETNGVFSVKKNCVTLEDGQRVVKGLGELLLRCYQEEILLEELKEFQEIVER